MTATARALATVWLGAWREAVANRRAFGAKVVVMAVNDLIWLLFWILFFNRLGSLRGWDLTLVATLQGVMYTSFGVALGVFANSRHVGELATTGGLDAALSLPVPVLPYVLCRRVEPSSVGDLLIGPVIFVVVARPGPTEVVLFVALTAVASVLATAVLVLMGAISLLTGRSEPAYLGFHTFTLFAAYPIDAFGGMAKLFLYVVIPAGLVASVPARLITDFQTAWALAFAAGALVFAAAGWITFDRAVSRYTSGAAWVEA